MADDSAERTFKFLRNGNAKPEDLAWSDGIAGARQAISESLSARNVAFLLGAGCSSLLREKTELGISTMDPLAKEFCCETLAARAAGFFGPKAPASDDVNNDEHDTGDFAEEHLVQGPKGDLVQLCAGEGAPEDPLEEPLPWRLTKAELDYLERHGIDLEGAYIRNLERLMEVLYAHRFVLARNTKAECWDDCSLVASMIEKVQTFLWTKVRGGVFSQGDTAVRDLYEQFYKKLVLRDRSLPRPWVFTTNYDVFNETAMDRLGIPYANGFTGVIERRFNPASFRYALAEQLDVANRKWSPSMPSFTSASCTGQ